MTRRSMADARARDADGAWDLDAPPAGDEPADGSEGPAPGVANAELLPRVFGLLLDVAMFAIIAEVGSRVAVWLAQSSIVRTTGGGNNDLAAMAILVASLGAILGSQLAIVVLSLRRYRATPGQAVFGLSTLGRESGLRLSPGQAILRWFVLYVPVLLFLSGSLVSATLQQIATVAKNPMQSVDALNSVLLWLPLLWALIVFVSIWLDARSRGLHDRLTGAVVVRRSGRPA